MLPGGGTVLRVGDEVLEGAPGAAAGPDQRGRPAGAVLMNQLRKEVWPVWRRRSSRRRAEARALVR